MCTRISLSLNGEALQQAFPMFHIPADWQARYNLSPGQKVLAVLNDGTHQAIRVFWGWRRPWEPQKSGMLVNARAESADRKPTFREAFTRQRCLVLADGFYEWQRVGRMKQPWRFVLKDRRPFGLAALWQEQDLPDGRRGPACVVLTTDANPLVAAVHPRMPVILPPEAFEIWLRPGDTVPWDLKPWLSPYPAERMEGYRVHPMVNNPRVDTPECIAPWTPPKAPSLL